MTDKRKKNRRTTRPLNAITPGTLGFYRFYALCEALRLMEWKARDKRLVIWDHGMTPNEKKLLIRAGKLIKMDDINAIRDYVINRGDRLMELNSNDN